ncbi:MAG: hypothetical protein ABIH42_02835 [Planctomycetota bacterium]
MMKNKRFTNTFPCPICGGNESLPRGKGIRCTGYLMEDSTAVVCTRKSDGSIKTIKTAAGNGYVYKLPDMCDKSDNNYKQSKKKVWKSPEEFASFFARKTNSKFSGIWNYQNADGKDFMSVLRFDKADREKEYRPLHKNSRGWLVGDPEGKLLLYNLPDILSKKAETVFIVEGEKSAEAGKSIGLLCTTTAHGANSPQRTDFTPLSGRNIVILPDCDSDGVHYAEAITEMLKDIAASIRIVNLPGLSVKGDLYDYVQQFDGKESSEIKEDIERMVFKMAKNNSTEFKPMSCEGLKEVLSLTIKHDNITKIVTFLCELSAYTENAQFNISFNAPSSTGKSYIPTEIAQLFPQCDVRELAYCSPTAFFHDQGRYDKEKINSQSTCQRRFISFSTNLIIYYFNI